MSGSETTQRRIGDWNVGAMLGSGSFAVVWKAEHRGTGQPAAIKEINLSRLNARLRQSLESEVSILKKISHRNVVQLYEVLEAHGRLFIVMEYCAGGDLAQLLRQRGRLPESTVRSLMQDLAGGLHELWMHHLVHRDLKPQNLLLVAAASTDLSATPPTLKIADFGFARALGPQLLAETLCGSPLYMAPEILLSQRYDAKADLWSVGAILFEALTGSPPYTGTNQVALLRSIREKEARLPPTLAAEISAPCRALVYALLRRNAVERIAFEDFFNHPFVSIGSDKDRPASAAPQHIVGFKGGGGESAAGSLPPPAAVPVSQLTEQFRPRLVSMRRPVQQPRLVPVTATHLPSHRGGVNTAQDTRNDSAGSVGDDDEYVLVTASTAEAAAAAEAEQRLQRPVQVETGATPPVQDAPAPRSAPAIPQEAFLLHLDGENEGKYLQNATTAAAASALSGGTQGSSGGGIDDAVPWQATSRRQFLRLVASILNGLGCDAAPAAAAAAAGRKNGQNESAVLAENISALALQLSFFLASLQLYDVVINGWEKHAEDAQPAASKHSMHSSLSSADSDIADLEPVRAEAAAVLQRADAAAAALQELTKQTNASSEDAVALPNPWKASHHAALGWAEEAASEELLGNYGRSEALYSRTGIILHFLASEAKSLPCQPPAEVDPIDEVRLRKCASVAAVRWAVCSSLVRKEAMAAAGGGD